MMIRLIRKCLPVVLVVGGLALVSCGPKYPNCEDDKHCQEKGEYCVDQLCRECKNDGNCQSKTGDKCSMCTGSYTCGKKPGCCHSDLDCPGGKCWKGEGEEIGKCGGECRANADCPEGKECIGERCVAKPKSECELGCGPGKKCVDNRCVWACDFASIYFDFNESKLTKEARKLLDGNVECAKTIGVPIVIEGHCDERGTDEYNLALGQRRADAARKFMKDRGIKTDMSTVSYGEERPVCTQSAESCWWRNRRDEFKVK